MSMPFGKHKGREIHDIARTDADYLTWLLGQSYLKPKLRGVIERALTAAGKPRQSSMPLAGDDPAAKLLTTAELLLPPKDDGPPRAMRVPSSSDPGVTPKRALGNSIAINTSDRKLFLSDQAGNWVEYRLVRAGDDDLIER